VQTLRHPLFFKVFPGFLLVTKYWNNREGDQASILRNSTSKIIHVFNATKFITTTEKFRISRLLKIKNHHAADYPVLWQMTAASIFQVLHVLFYYHPRPFR